ncbi:MAG: aldo/keto reductase [Lachnospiraceae bacterium]|nr:aldo/keto reductase [Lachnospiraceae bacterium]
MHTITLGKTGIKTPQNAFGALPVQRVDMDTACKILRRAYDGGMTYFDTARAYSDSEEKIGEALSDVRSDIYIASKSMGRTPDDVKKELDISLKNMKTDYIDVYQLHCVPTCYRPDDGSGMYELLEDLKRQGVIRHIGITAHKIGIAEEIVDSGLYETLQFPFSYLSIDRDIALVNKCRENNIGFIAMKGLSGGLITNFRAAYAFIAQYDNVLPIWGIQKMSELEEWLSLMENDVVMDDELQAVIDSDLKALQGDFCRGCGYCMPCPAGIEINNCARISLLLRRAPSKDWLSEKWQANMKMIENCLHCGACSSRCPYGLDTPTLLQKNYEDYKKVLSGEVQV